MGDVDDAAMPGEGPEPSSLRPEDLRAGDADRELVLERLRAAQAEGRLDLDEFDERVAATVTARTYGELAALTADLPGGPPVPRPLGAPPPVSQPPVLQPPAAPAARERPDLRAATAGWAAVSATTLVIWLVVGVTTGALGYPWWIWVTGPWGVALLVSWMGSRASGR